MHLQRESMNSCHTQFCWKEMWIYISGRKKSTHMWLVRCVVLYPVGVLTLEGRWWLAGYLMPIGLSSTGKTSISTGSRWPRGLTLSFHGDMFLVPTSTSDQSLSISNRHFLRDAVLHIILIYPEKKWRLLDCGILCFWDFTKWDNGPFIKMGNSVEGCVGAC